MTIDTSTATTNSPIARGTVNIPGQNQIGAPTPEDKGLQVQCPTLHVRTALQAGNYWECMNKCTAQMGADAAVCAGYCLFDI